MISLIPCLCILQEFGQANVRQWMFQQAQYRFQRGSDHVGAGFRTLHDMKRAADRSSKDLRLPTLDRIDLGDLGDQFNTVPAAIVDASDERGYIGSTGLGGQNGLTGGETQGAVRTDAIVGKPFQRFYAI